MFRIRSLVGARAETAIRPMDGPLAPNDRLESLQSISLSGEGVVDDVAEGPSGTILVSCDDRVLQVNLNGGHRVFAECGGRITALCRGEDGSLVVGIEGWGLKRLGKNGELIASYRNDDSSNRWSPTALVSDAGGGVYFAIGSRRHTATDWVQDLMERNVDGYVGYWYPRKDERPRIVADRLAWPYGLLIEPGDGREDKLLVAESWSHDILRYHIDGTGLGVAEKLTANMVGYPARISAAHKGGYWVALFARRTQLVELVLKEDAFRKAMMESLAPELWIRPALTTTGDHHEPLQMGGIRALGVRKVWAPPRSYGLVVRLDNDGVAAESLQSRVGGSAHGITSAREIGTNLIMVSQGKGAVLILPLNQ